MRQSHSQDTSQHSNEALDLPEAVVSETRATRGKVTQTGRFVLPRNGDSQETQNPLHHDLGMDRDSSIWPRELLKHTSFRQPRSASAQPSQTNWSQSLHNRQPVLIEAQQSRDASHNWHGTEQKRQSGFNYLALGPSNHQTPSIISADRLTRPRESRLPGIGNATSLGTDSGFPNFDSSRLYRAGRGTPDWSSGAKGKATIGLERGQNFVDVLSTTSTADQPQFLRDKELICESSWGRVSQGPPKSSSKVSSGLFSSRRTWLDPNPSRPVLEEKLSLLDHSNRDVLYQFSTPGSSSLLVSGRGRPDQDLTEIKRPAASQFDSRRSSKRRRARALSTREPIDAQSSQMIDELQVPEIPVNSPICSDSSGPGDTEGTKARLSETRCMCCRRKHRKCDRKLPTCGACVNAGRVCTYPNGITRSTLDDQDRRSGNCPNATSEGDSLLIPQHKSSSLEKHSLESQANGATTSTKTTSSSIGTQTSPLLDPRMTFLRWTTLLRSAAELHRKSMPPVVQSLQDANRASPVGFRETLLEAGQVGLGFFKEIRDSNRLDEHGQ